MEVANEHGEQPHWPAAQLNFFYFPSRPRRNEAVPGVGATLIIFKSP